MKHRDDSCGVALFAELLGDEWKILILRDLAEGPRRFTQLERSVVGISPRTLSQRLRCLQDDNLVVRRPYAEAPPRVDYELTEMGREVVPIIEMMRAYGERWLCPPQPGSEGDSRASGGAPAEDGAEGQHSEEGS